MLLAFIDKLDTVFGVASAASGGLVTRHHAGVWIQIKNVLENNHLLSWDTVRQILELFLLYFNQITEQEWGINWAKQTRAMYKCYISVKRITSLLMEIMSIQVFTLYIPEQKQQSQKKNNPFLTSRGHSWESFFWESVYFPSTWLVLEIKRSWAMGNSSTCLPETRVTLVWGCCCLPPNPRRSQAVEKGSCVLSRPRSPQAGGGVGGSWSQPSCRLEQPPTAPCWGYQSKEHTGGFTRRLLCSAVGHQDKISPARNEHLLWPESLSPYPAKEQGYHFSYLFFWTIPFPGKQPLHLP